MAHFKSIIAIKPDIVQFGDRKNIFEIYTSCGQLDEKIINKREFDITKTL